MVINYRWILSATFLFLISFVIVIGWSSFIDQIYQFRRELVHDNVSNHILNQSSRHPSDGRCMNIRIASNKKIHAGNRTNSTTIYPSNNNRQQTQFTLNCGSMTSTSPNDTDYLEKFEQDQDYNYSSPSSTCPDIFKWIHEDLKPWNNTGITREILERGHVLSDFRLVILGGRAYLEKYRGSFQTRDVFTIWGILQLLRLYPGKVPDLELLFNAGDLPVVGKQHFQGSMPPPPVFHYCGKKDAFDIIFPDWSFWGWGEIGIRPWETILQKIQERNNKTIWKDKIPYAFWKGNTGTSRKRSQLKKCNSSHHHERNARIYSLDWGEEIAKGFRSTKLEDQCTHRYKIYVEGISWSVSEKYIMACDSMTMIIEPQYYDFFTRGLVPLKHYWPISTENMCRDIKYAVDWGNTHPDQAEEIGKSGSDFIAENLKMKFVYDYMFHALKEYSKLLRFQPTIPEGAVEICAETIACPMWGQWREYMVESMVKSPSDTPPCTMPTPTDTPSVVQPIYFSSGTGDRGRRPFFFTSAVIVIFLSQKFWPFGP